MTSSHFILWQPLLLLPSIFPSISNFSYESAVCIRWPEYWSFSFNVILPMSIQGWFPLTLTGLIFLLSKGVSRVFSSTTIQKHYFFSLLYGPSLTSIHGYWKKHSFVGKSMSLLFNALSKFVIAFLPRSKCLLISWLQSLSEVIWSPRNESLSLFLPLTEEIKPSSLVSVKLPSWLKPKFFCLQMLESQYNLGGEEIQKLVWEWFIFKFGLLKAEWSQLMAPGY